MPDYQKIRYSLIRLKFLNLFIYPIKGIRSVPNCALYVLFAGNFQDDHGK